MATWSSAVVLVSFLLQVALLLLLARRRPAGEVWIFTGLLVLYAVRSILLFVLFSRVSRAVYGQLYDGLSLMDLGLQVALAGELLVGMAGRVVHGVRWGVTVGLGALVIAAGATAGLVALLPGRSPVPADRGAIFTGVLFAALFGVAVWVGLRGWARTVVTGLAAVGLAGAISQCGRSVAAFHRDGLAYVGWAYLDAAVYLMALVYWIACRTRAGTGARATEEAGFHARGTI